MSDELWRDFVHTGPDTIAGRYLRTFWQPVARSQDLAVGRSVPVHVMSESFTLYRGESGAPYLLDFRCAHRGTQLPIGWVEGDAIRCRYHGWVYNGSGQCVEQPGEDPALATKIRIGSYPCQEYLGLVFAYLGESDPPPMRRFPEFESPAVLEWGRPEIWPCNYFNRVENDPGHVPFTHRESARRRGNTNQLIVRNTQSHETEFGVRSVVVTTAAAPQQYIDFHMPNINQVRTLDDLPGTLFWRVPIDDERCISFPVGVIPPTGAGAGVSRRQLPDDDLDSGSEWKVSEAILAGEMRLENIDVELGTAKMFWMEDYLTQVGQSAIPDRSREHLGRVDESVVLKRAIWQRELRALMEGRPLKQWTAPGVISTTPAPQR